MGRCYEEEGAPPFWLWAQFLGAYIQQTRPQQLASEMGPGVADIAEIIPELRGDLPDLAPPPVLGPEPVCTCCDRADTLLYPSTGTGRTDVSDRSKAISHLDESRFISRELGMRPLLKRLPSRREILRT